MASVNKKRFPITHEGAKAKIINAEQQLRRAVMSCLLWENEFYENGENIADRIKILCETVDTEIVKELAIEAKYDMGIRHAPLWMAVSRRLFEKDFLNKMIRRVDDMSELLSLYWKDGKKPIPKQMKLAFTDGLNKFDAYQLSKYKGNGKAVSLKDLICLVHPKPKDKEQERIFKAILNKKLEAPNTWEVALSGGADKKTTFETLISENKIGALAFLRNLRNMQESGVTNIKDGLKSIDLSKIIPFQIIQAARYAPNYESEIEEVFFKTISGHKKLTGKTVLLVDVSGSMSWPLTDKSNATRQDVAQAFAMILREICEEVNIFAFGNNLYTIPNRRGFALSDLLKNKSEGTYLGEAVKAMPECDRLIVITDEQSKDKVPDPKGTGYMINIASNKNGVGYGKWLHIDGWSQAVIRYIQEVENDRQGT